MPSAARSTGGSPAVDARTPNLFIIGAPKAGTTFVHHALDLVPDVFMSSVKEPGFFTSDRDQRRGLGYYLDAYFAKAAGHPLRGESTPWYLYSEAACQRIAALPTPEPPKLVVLVRRPSARARSMYLDQVRLNRERRSFEEAVAAEVEGLAAGELVDDVRQRYVWGGLYTDHIVRWQEAFGPERVHVAVLDDLTADPERAWADLAAFLDHDLGPSRFDEVGERDRNRAGTLRWPRVDAFIRSFEGREQPLVEAAKQVLPPGLHRRVLQQVGRINRTPSHDPEVQGDDAATLEWLDELYAPEVERLEGLLDRSLPTWRRGAERDDRLVGGTVAAPAADDAAGSDEPAAPERPLRIVHLLARSHRRGAELVAVELADELDRKGHRNRLVALGPALGGGQEEGLVPLDASEGVGLRDLVVRVRALRRLLAEEPADVVLAHGGWAAQVAALAVPRPGPLLVWQRILSFPDQVWSPARRRWWRAVASRFDVGVALTDDLEDELRRLGFDRPVWVIPNSRQPDRFLALDRAAAAGRLRAELAVPDDVPLIGFVGHLVQQKRPERALEVVARLRDLGTDVHLVVAGDGPRRAALEVEARTRGLDGSVTFLGHRPDVEHVFGGVALALLTSEAEGIPGVAIEALMAGCPVVTVPVGGVAQVVADGVTGVVLERHDPSEMAQAVAALLADPARLAAMGEEARARTTSFTASATAAVYAERLSAALAER
ncbi:MAG: glycosyltransferase [Acidimicrobiia bacterium]|jgi:glycosyltransferase involved in cell wall biosynthesis